VGCFSETAPGIEDYGGFNNAMLKRVAAEGNTLASYYPPGLPLSIHTSFKTRYTLSSAVSPGQAALVKKNLAKRPPVTTEEVVIKIETMQFPDGEFSLPAGFTKLHVIKPYE
jgi:hypothetical protein